MAQTTEGSILIPVMLLILVFLKTLTFPSKALLNVSCPSSEPFKPSRVHVHSHQTFNLTNMPISHKVCVLLLPSQSGEVELLNAVNQEALQVHLADSSYWVDVSTGTVILGEVPCQT